MIRYSCIASDLGRIYPDTEFIEPKLLLIKIETFFHDKFNLFLKENKISNLSHFSKAIEFLNTYAYIPLTDVYVDVNRINGLKTSFVNLYKEELYNFIPSECKKTKKSLNVSKLSNKNLLELKFFLFYKEVIFSSINEINFHFFLDKYNVGLNIFPEKYNYLFDKSIVPIRQYYPLGSRQHNTLSAEDVFIFTKMDVFYKFLLQDTNSDIRKLINSFFIGNYYSLKIHSRDNYKTREILHYKDDINKEIIKRDLSFYEIIPADFVNYIKGITRSILTEEHVEDILFIMNFFWKESCFDK